MTEGVNGFIYRGYLMSGNKISVFFVHVYPVSELLNKTTNFSEW